MSTTAESALELAQGILIKGDLSRRSLDWPVGQDRAVARAIIDAEVRALEWACELPGTFWTKEIKTEIARLRTERERLT